MLQGQASWPTTKSRRKPVSAGLQLPNQTSNFLHTDRLYAGKGCKLSRIKSGMARI